ncbi:MAG TPA: hypothetical protein VIK95_15615 [Egibacteraceae bacterium]
MPSPVERLRRRLPPPRDPWARAPVGELGEQLLPRWFVILALLSIPVAIAVTVAAFAVFTPADQPVAARRPPPEAGSTLSTAVGEVAVGDSEPVVYRDACRLLQGVRVAGSPGEQDLLRRGLAALCNTAQDEELRERLALFAAQRGVVRFAVFEHTGVDSTLDASPGEPPVVLVNNRYAVTSPRWVAPLVAHDVTYLALAPGVAGNELAATQAEDAVCRALLAEDERSPACRDAAALLAEDDPLGALRAVGYR